jgi:hypothetical protein
MSRDASSASLAGVVSEQVRFFHTPDTDFQTVPNNEAVAMPCTPQQSDRERMEFASERAQLCGSRAVFVKLQASYLLVRRAPSCTYARTAIRTANAAGGKSSRVRDMRLA